MKSGTEGSVLSDGRIVELYWQRNEDAICATDRKYGRFLLSVAGNILSDARDCDECLNDTYTDAWNAMPPQRPLRLPTFLAVIMRRTAIDRYREKGREKRIASELSVALSEVEEFLSDGGDPYAEVCAEELGRIFSDFLRSLSRRQAYVFMSRYYFARPIREIATLLGCSRSTVEKDLAAVRGALKIRLEKEGYSL
jgi:RNA polymerase sigma-70 factor (ECF subfamily)